MEMSLKANIIMHYYYHKLHKPNNMTNCIWSPEVSISGLTGYMIIDVKKQQHSRKIYLIVALLFCIRHCFYLCSLKPHQTCNLLDLDSRHYMHVDLVSSLVRDYLLSFVESNAGFSE